DVFIHNHPSGFLIPSDNDLRIACRAAEEGTGAYITDNGVEKVYVVAEPVRRKKIKALDPDRICAALEKGGSAALRLPSWEPRESQLDLVRLVVRGFNEDALVAAEAGTGVGKSFAYLLPAVHYALENGERIVISTATINLQQQLFEKDIPLVALSAGRKIKAVLMKGRGNYLCLRRLEDARGEPDLRDEYNDELRRIALWAETAGTGSRSDLSFVPSGEVWSRICSEADLCMGMRCPVRERCFVLSLRKEAADAKLLVVNHHLLFADLAARREGAGYEGTVVLPPYTRVIIDEAHTMEDAATSFFSKEFSRLGIFRQLGRLYRRRRANQRGLLVRLASVANRDPSGDRLDEAALLIEKIRAAADSLDEAGLLLCGGGAGQGFQGTFRLTPGRENAFLPLFSHFASLRKHIGALGDMVRTLLEECEDLAEGNEGLESCIWEIKTVLRRLDDVGGICSSFIAYREKPEEVMWLEPRRGRGDSGGEGSNPWITYTVTPVDIAPALEEALFRPNKSVICTSATLTVGALSFGYWAGRCGLSLAGSREYISGCFPSPFPYHVSTLLAVPSDAPLPEEPGYQDFVDMAVTRLAAAAGGSALALFTSYQSMESAWAAAAGELREMGIRCLKQGDDDRSRLLSNFLEDRTSVLFATDSFWQGVDAPGDTLRLVILCRLPFRAPNDPVFEARGEALEKKGKSSFMELSLPESVMKFKQGFGRLMRRSSDRGVVAVLDGRIIKKRYGEIFIRSLPETKRYFGEFESLLRKTESFLFDEI
ncbi:MAG: ATP-dependent DNA helicase DinG, partial [Treponema sp.]|nr:ATP-dependent DNA helicase DinG [Treponema sp.]